MAQAANNPVPSLSLTSPTQAVAGATAALTLTGTGFIASTVILVNGVAVPTTYQSATHVVAQVPAPAGTPGTVNVQAQNPAPGGGTSPVLQVSVSSLVVTASNSDGTNTGTARLGMPVSFTTVNTNTAHASVAWSLQGPGTLTYSGSNYQWATYTPPATMPSNTTVTVTTYLLNLPALTTTYTITLINPVPTIGSVNGANGNQVAAGTSVPLTLTGNGFVPGTVIFVNGAAVSATYQSLTSIVAQVPAPAGTPGTVNVQAQNPAPGGGLGPIFQLASAAWFSMPRTRTEITPARQGSEFR